MKQITLSASEIAKMVNGRVIGNPDRTINNVCGIRDAKENDLSFVSSKRYQKMLEGSPAGVILICEDLASTDPGERSFVVCQNVDVAFSIVLAAFAEEPPSDNPGIHPSAVVAADAVIGKNVSIGANAVVE
jgi:UDP-3-O-[3-hydroxymyristoyl] glucosamine N-acyltransferase